MPQLSACLCANATLTKLVLNANGIAAQVLTALSLLALPEALRGSTSTARTQLACFPGTKLQILTPEALQGFKELAAGLAHNASLRCIDLSRY